MRIEIAEHQLSLIEDLRAIVEVKRMLNRSVSPKELVERPDGEVLGPKLIAMVHQSIPSSFVRARSLRFVGTGWFRHLRVCVIIDHKEKRRQQGVAEIAYPPLDQTSLACVLDGLDGGAAGARRYRRSA